MNKEKSLPLSYKAWRKLRNDWGEINPVTKIIPNKKRNKREKYKKHDLEEREVE